MKTTFYWNHEKNLEEIAFKLQSGAVFAGTSDTVPGLLALATEGGLKTLSAIKNRENKPYIVLIPSIKEAKKIIHPDQYFLLEKITDSCWPGPLTVIFKANPTIEPFMQNVLGTIALRMPNHAGLQKLMRLVKKPLFSTSANRPGQATPTDPLQIDAHIIAECAGIVLDSDISDAMVIPSTILDYSQQIPRIIRQGAYSKKQLEHAPGLMLE